MSDGPTPTQRRSRSTGRLLDSIRAGALALIAASAAPVSSADGASDCLYRSFDIPAGEAWGSNAIELTPGQWRIGAPRGAPVDEAAMKRHLAGVGRLLIGGVCAGSREQETYRACGFALAEPALAGQLYDDLRWRWSSTTGTSLVVVPGAADAAVSVAFSVPEPVSVHGAPEDFVGMQAPVVLLTALRQAYGATLSFSFRSVPNPLVAAKSVASDGWVVLCSDREGLSAARRTSER